MKTTYISTILFLCLILFISFADFKLQKLYNNISVESDIIEDLLNDYNWDLAYEKTTTLIENIKKESLLSSVYVNHVDFDNISNEAIKLCSYIQCKDISESHVSANILKSYAQIIKELNKFSLKNIL
ncbi:DUF4363 family protein [Clostridium sp. HCP1S3_B4]|uniref:DUF4363 family protein n=1 Tax=unclassified Clostridium TaxID=2614128 RepID=UPI0016AB472E|nr:DUF4363 family protein [Clostridiales bacterium]MDY2729989.1 DUF4363 family protein [Clostridium sp.]NLK24741.1 DUF4363 family protein [Clostridiales bacterium]